MVLLSEHFHLTVRYRTSFYGKNPDSALKLGQARGMQLAATMQSLSSWYSAQLKAVVGTGAADKSQVQHGYVNFTAIASRKPMPLMHWQSFVMDIVCRAW